MGKSKQVCRALDDQLEHIAIYMCPKDRKLKTFRDIAEEEILQQINTRYNHQRNAQFICKEVVHILKNKYAAKG
jgi:hypothetical protein